MKIIQLLARIEGSGVTKYITEFNKGLVKLGHDVEIIYLDPELYNDNSDRTGLDVNNAIKYDWSDKTVEHINSADLVIVNSIIARKSIRRDEWIELVTNKITTKKVIVINDHKPAGFRAYYGDLLKRNNFWLAFNKICTFGYDALVYKEIRKAIGDDEAQKRFMQLIHPFSFDDSIKNTWIAPNNKLKRLCYFGRHSPFKDNIRLLRGRDTFWKHGWELEMRGVRCVINLINIPDFKYIIDEKTKKPKEKIPYVKGDKYELSPYTYWCDDNTKLRKNWGLSRQDLMIESPEREKDRIYIFGAYKHKDGMYMMNKYAFSCDFYNLDSENCYGNNIEYTIFEMVQYGSIPVLDKHAGDSIHLLNTDGTFSKNTFSDLNVGLFLSKDLSDIDICVDKMDILYNDAQKYNEFRNNIYKIVKQHSNPELICKKFIEDVYE